VALFFFSFFWQSPFFLQPGRKIIFLLLGIDDDGPGPVCGSRREVTFFYLFLFLLN